jgi:hypothetical protein
VGLGGVLGSVPDSEPQEDDTDPLPLLLRERDIGGEGSKERTKACCGVMLQTRHSPMKLGNVYLSKVRAHTEYHGNSLWSASAAEIATINAKSSSRGIWPSLDSCGVTSSDVCRVVSPVSPLDGIKDLGKNPFIWGEMDELVDSARGRLLRIFLGAFLCISTAGSRRNEGGGSRYVLKLECVLEEPESGDREVLGERSWRDHPMPRPSCVPRG